MRISRFAITLASFGLTVLAQVASADTAADDKAIRDVAANYVTAFNKGDAKAVAAMFAPDADTVNAGGQKSTGSAEIEKSLTSDLAGPMKGASLAVTVDSVRMVGTDTAVSNGGYTFVGLKGPDGKEVPPIAGMYTTVMVKKDGKWWISALRAMIPQPAPGAPPTH